MKLFLIDEFDFSKVNEIKESLLCDDSKFCLLDDFDEDLLNDGFERVVVLSALEHNFVSKNVFKFIKKAIKKNINTKFSVAIIENGFQNSKVAIDWFSSLNQDGLLDVAVVGEFDINNLKEDLQSLKKVIFGGGIENSEKVKPGENQVLIYTDGACSGNPGAGGWGAILMHGNHAKEISGFDPETTNNKMELTAVIMALSSLKQPCNVELYSDSAYVVNAIKQGWLENWKKNGWIGSDKKPVKNIELWQCLVELMQKHNVNFNKVKGHADNEFNNRCDQLATGEIAKNANNI